MTPLLAPDVLARFPLSPLLAAQALYVRKRAQILPEPPGPRVGRVGQGPPLRLLIIGDSSAAGVGAPTQSAAFSGQLVHHLARQFDVDWQLEAATGATTKTTLENLLLVPPARFDVAVTALGVNDVTGMTSRRQWIARQRALHDLLRDRFGVTGIYASGVPPMGRFPLLPNPLRWVLGQQAIRFDRALIGLVAGQDGIHHVPVDFPHEARFAASDGFHPSPVAYTDWGAMLARLIAQA
ncbi:MAG: lysophospholipase L1-like esterase [Paracoccaceae bacterium]|jgi:lysophospholipase L1-like esterase